jgi:hypothetical protein
MKWTLWLPMALLLPSCGLSGLLRGSGASANASALYDPPTVTLLPDMVYRFAEGTLAGRGQKFHSDYSYRRAVIIGSK